MTVPLPPVFEQPAEPQLPLGKPESKAIGRTVARHELHRGSGAVTTITMAAGAKLVHVGFGRGSGGMLCAWFDTHTGPFETIGSVTRRYRVFRTGDAIPLNGLTTLVYQGTVADPSYSDEWHVYEEIG